MTGGVGEASKYAKDGGVQDFINEVQVTNETGNKVSSGVPISGLDDPSNPEGDHSNI